MEPGELVRRFTYHPPTSEADVTKYEEIRAKALEFARFVCERTPEGREESLAVTHIENAVFWANAAIARDGK